MKRDLREALLEANMRQYAASMEQAGEPEFSPKYRRSCIRMLSGPNAWAKRFARPLWKKLLQTAACILLAFTLALGALMGVSPTVRAAVRNWFREITGETIVYQTEVHGPPVAAAARYRLADLPEGWRVRRLQSDGYDSHWNYQNGKAWLDFRCIGPSPAEEISGPGASQVILHTQEDTLQMSRETISFRGCSADYYADGDSVLLTWEDKEGLLFWLRGSGVSKDELLALAENIQLYQGRCWTLCASWLPEGYQRVAAMDSAMGDSGRAEWRQEQHVITCLYSGAAPLRLPEGEPESMEIKGAEAQLWSTRENSPVTIVVDQGGTSVTIGGGTVVSAGGSGGEQSEKITMQWRDKATGIEICLSGAVEREELIAVAEGLTFQETAQ